MPFDTQAAVNALWGESVTYTRAANGVSFDITAGRHILGEAEGRTSYGVYTIRKERFTLATGCLGDDLEPRLRDTIRPNTLTADLTLMPARVVTSVTGSPFLKFWVVEAAYPSLATELSQTATVKRPSPTATDEGFRNPNLTDAYVDVACRLQPESREREWDTAGRVTTREKLVCVFGSAVTLNAGDVVEVSGVKYETTEQSELEELGVLTFARVERIS